MNKMKRIKYLSAALLFLIGFLLTNEGFSLRLFYLFDKANSITITIPPETQKEFLVDTIQTASKKTNTPIYILKIQQDDYKKVYSFYHNFDDVKTLQKALKINEQQITSLLFGKLQILFFPLEELIDFSINEKVESISSLSLFSKRISDDFQVISQNSMNQTDEVLLSISIVWIIIFLALILTTIFEKMSIQKEYLISLTVGENPTQYIFKHIIKDGLLYVSLFLVGGYFLSKNQSIEYSINALSMLFLVFIILNSILYVTLYKVKVKEAFSNTGNNYALLLVSKTFLAIVTLLFILALAFSIGQFQSTAIIIQQQQIFNQYDGYSSLLMGYEIDFYDENYEQQNDRNSRLYTDLYHRLVMSEQAQILSILSSFNPETTTVFYDNNAYAKFNQQQQLPSINSSTTFLVPSTIQIDNTLTQRLSSMVKNETIEYVNYDADVEALYFEQDHELEKWQVAKNPIILVSSRPENVIFSKKNIQFKIDRETLMSYLSSLIPIENTKIDLNKVSIINVTNQFKQQLETSTTLLRVIVGLSCLLLILVVFLYQIIIQLFYRLNKIELSIKKTLGYHLFEINKDLINYFLKMNAIILLVVLVINGWLQLFSTNHIIISYLFNILLQSTLFILHSKQNYSDNVVTTLKGKQ